MNDTIETEPVEIPADLLARIEERVSYTEFDSASEYIEYTMKEVLYHVEQETADEDFEEVDEQEVRDRLRSLGYLDR